MRYLHHTLIIFTLLMVSTLAQATQVPGPLVDTKWVKSHLKDIVILDVRDAKNFISKPVFKRDKKTGNLILVKVGGHIPGAHRIDYKKLRTSKMINNIKIDEMLPGKAAFEKIMQSFGLNKNATIVIMSEGESNKDMTAATRLYWSLKYYGEDNMAILNGGMAQWLKDGGNISISPTKVKTGNWVATAERNDILATSDDIKKALKDPKVQLVDTRNVSLYMGTYKKSYVFANGHIPGAKNFPNELVTGPKGKADFTSAKEVQSISKAVGIDPKGEMITYCNSGHLATGSWFLYHEVLGNKNVKMYDGSMHEWTKEKGQTVSVN
jgi:thiosulfate/3-mercaptopyruvate sulfurtransferase